MPAKQTEQAAFNQVGAADNGHDEDEDGEVQKGEIIEDYNNADELREYLE